MWRCTVSYRSLLLGLNELRTGNGAVGMSKGICQLDVSPSTISNTFQKHGDICGSNWTRIISRLSLLRFLVISCHLLPFLAIACHFLPFLVISCHLLPFLVIYCHFSSFLVIYCHFLPFLVIYLHFLLLLAISCHLPQFSERVFP